MILIESDDREYYQIWEGCLDRDQETVVILFFVMSYGSVACSGFQWQTRYFAGSKAKRQSHQRSMAYQS